MTSLKHLRELSEKATKGEWYLINYNCKPTLSLIPTLNTFSALENTILTFQPTKQRQVKKEVMEYIVAVNPQTILQLITELEEKTVFLNDLFKSSEGQILGTFHMVKQADGSLKREYSKTDLGISVDRARETLRKWCRDE